MNDRATQRLDKWLWQARFFKTRTLAARIVSDGGVRLNGTRATKTSAAVRPGDTLTFAQGRAIRVVRITAIGTRRGPAAEAATLYEDLSPAVEVRQSAGPRPVKKERRALENLRRTP